MASTFLRPVGMLEKLYTARHSLGIYNSVIVTGTYITQQIDEASLQRVLSEAVSGVIARHPALSCYLEGEATSKPAFGRLKTIKIDEILHICTLGKHESLVGKLQNLHDTPWESGQRCVWKMVAIRDSAENRGGEVARLHIAFVYHHAIGDGLSGIAFHRSLLQELKNTPVVAQSSQEMQGSIDVPTILHFIEPVEKLVKLPLSWAFLIKQVLQEYAPRWLVGAPAPAWAGLPCATLDERPFRSRCRIVRVTPEEVTKLLQASKRQSLTLTSLLNAVLVVSLAEAVPDAPRFVGMTPYTLRRVTGTSMDEMVNQTSAFETDFSIALLEGIRNASNIEERNDNIWKVARYFQAQMQAELAKCPHDNLVGLLPYVSDHHNYYRKKIGREREATFELSNLGVFPVPEHTARSIWQLESMMFTQGAAPVGPAFAVNCVSVQGGPLTIALTWQDGTVREEVIEALAKSFETLSALFET